MEPGSPSLLASLLDALYPPRCPLCGRVPAGDEDGEAARAELGLGCPAHRLPLAPPGPRCGRCAAPLLAVLPDGERCPACRRRAPGWSRLVCLADYRAQPAAREWLLALKHGGRPDLARVLGAELGRALARVRGAAADAERPAVLVPVPLHGSRRLERGYDQARLLAAAAARAAGLPCARALVRRRATRVQGAPGAVSRAANVRDAFALRARAARALAGVEAWLVDDVVTSGATAAECARVLRGAGARWVGVLCVARASLSGAPGRGGAGDGAAGLA